jgi:flagellin
MTNNFTSTVMNQHKTDTEQTLAKIAAVRELEGQDGATMINANQLNSQIATMTQQVQNENNRVGMLQIADGALQGIQAGTDRLNELSSAYNNATLNNDQRAALSQEFADTREAMSEMLSQTTFNGQGLFGGNSPIGLGSATQEAQVSINNLLAGITSTTSSYSQMSEIPMGQNINQFNQSSLGLTASTTAQSHNTAILQQQMAALLKF